MENEKVDTKEVMHDISCASLELGTHTKKPGQCNCLVAECSRLASRVEELDERIAELECELRDSVDTMGFAGRVTFLLTNEIHELRMGAPKIHDRLKESIESAERVLAGAHAEER